MPQAGRRPIAYFRLDAKAKTASFIAPCDLAEEKARGGRFICEYTDGMREEVAPDEIEEPYQPSPPASAEYVQSCMEAVLALMSESMAPAIALMPASVRRPIQDKYERFQELVEDGDIQS